MTGAMKEQDRKIVLELKRRLSADLQKRVSAVPRKRGCHFTGTSKKKTFPYDGWGQEGGISVKPTMPSKWPKTCWSRTRPGCGQQNRLRHVLRRSGAIERRRETI